MVDVGQVLIFLLLLFLECFYLFQEVESLLFVTLYLFLLFCYYLLQVDLVAWGDDVYGGGVLGGILLVV